MATLPDDQLARLALKYWKQDGAAALAVAVALAESGGRTDALGDTGITGAKWGPSVGLWQIRSLNADKGTGRTRDEIANRDPDTNARHAFEISGGGSNWKPWSAYTSGAHKAYFKRAAAAVEAAGGSIPDKTSPGDWNVDSVLPLDPITDPLLAVGDFLGKLGDPALWRRIGLGALGAAVIVLAIVLLARDLIPGGAAVAALTGK